MCFNLRLNTALGYRASQSDTPCICVNVLPLVCTLQNRSFTSFEGLIRFVTIEAQLSILTLSKFSRSNPSRHRVWFKPEGGLREPKSLPGPSATGDHDRVHPQPDTHQISPTRQLTRPRAFNPRQRPSFDHVGRRGYHAFRIARSNRDGFNGLTFRNRDPAHVLR